MRPSMASRCPGVLKCGEDRWRNTAPSEAPVNSPKSPGGGERQGWTPLSARHLYPVDANMIHALLGDPSAEPDGREP